MLKFRNLIALLAMVGLAACGGSDNPTTASIQPDNAGSPSANTEEATDVDASNEDESTSLQASGATVMETEVISFSEQGEYEADSDVAMQIDLLKKVTAVHETENGYFDLYSGDDVILVLQQEANQMLTVADSGNRPFNVTEISYEETPSDASTEDQESPLMMAVLEFNMEICPEPVETPESQEQDQMQEQEQEQEQDQSAGQDDGKSQEDETAQDQEPLECRIVTASLTINEVEQEEEAQDKEPTQDEATQDQDEEAQDKEPVVDDEEAQDKDPVVDDEEDAQDKDPVVDDEEEAQDKDPVVDDEEEAQDKDPVVDDEEEAQDKEPSEEEAQDKEPSLEEGQDKE